MTRSASINGRERASRSWTRFLLCCLVGCAEAHEVPHPSPDGLSTCRSSVPRLVRELAAGTEWRFPTATPLAGDDAGILIGVTQRVADGEPAFVTFVLDAAGRWLSTTILAEHGELGTVSRDENSPYAIFDDGGGRCLYANLASDGSLRGELTFLDVETFRCRQTATARVGDKLALLARYTFGRDGVPGKLGAPPLDVGVAFELPGLESGGLITVAGAFAAATMEPSLVQTFSLDIEGNVGELRLRHAPREEPIAARLISPDTLVLVTQEGRAGDITIELISAGGSVASVSLPGMLDGVAAAIDDIRSHSATAVAWRDWRAGQHRLALLWKSESGWESENIYVGAGPAEVAVSGTPTGAVIVWLVRDEVWSLVLTCS